MNFVIKQGSFNFCKTIPQFYLEIYNYYIYGGAHYCKTPYILPRPS